MSLDAEFDKMYQEMERSHIKPLWTEEIKILPRTPQPKAVPWLWKWSQLHRLASRAGDLVTLERGGDRRAIGLINPGLGGQPYATPTLWAAVQWLNGREVAPAHRHCAQAVRFIIEGQGRVQHRRRATGFFWSAATSRSIRRWPGTIMAARAMVRQMWMDGLDIPLNNYLECVIF